MINISPVVRTHGPRAARKISKALASGQTTGTFKVSGWNYQWLATHEQLLITPMKEDTK